MSTFRDQLARVFLRHGGRAHYIAQPTSPNDLVGAALCGLKPWPLAWHGTGDQWEIDTATAMPLCSTCNRKVLMVEDS